MTSSFWQKTKTNSRVCWTALGSHSRRSTSKSIRRSVHRSTWQGPLRLVPGLLPSPLVTATLKSWVTATLSNTLGSLLVSKCRRIVRRSTMLCRTQLRSLRPSCPHGRSWMP
ncbi:hypothetical protein TNCT_471091 [Trichonephila clavata]|uniref:Uncharacterized protein n=1 Tax=Trichonephila clavata TaxID=2740835 RepID=A0A8X6GM10_TRICU|nr:hypothetical protein TNCT_471091 [Trichonephila clavata]